MNFFEAQDDARRKTWQLALLFGAAVLSLIVMTNLLVAGVYLWTSNYAYSGPMNLMALLQALPAESWLLISVGVMGVISVASLYKYLLIRGGGRTIAESLGGRLLTHDTTDGHGRRLLNVVEEMAIASGTAVPPVYLIPEQSINAFAAGFGPDDAIIGINQGTLDHLSRDELQGVIAHEFSHILNGDVSINLRLIAILHGILFLGMVGYGILRGVGYSGGRRSNNNGAPILALAVGLLVIGYAGTFFGNLIKAAVSRQREYLADAAAVQFTRNPEGIAGALKKIGGLSAGSLIERPAAAEASHLFFGQVRTLFLNNLMSTHPPLDKRIRAIDPRWDGEFPLLSGAEMANADQPAGASGFAGGYHGDSVQVGLQNITLDGNPQQVTDRVGTLDNRSLEAARALIASTSTLLREAAHDPWGARGLIYAVLLDDDPQLRDRQFAHLQRQAEAGVPAYTEKLIRPLAELDPPRRLALVEMAMPALKTLSHQQYERFTANVIELIRMDQRISLPEWILHRLLVKELKPHFEGHQIIRPKYRQVEALAEQTATLLSTIARFGAGSADGADTAGRQAFAAGVASLKLSDGVKLEFEGTEDPNFTRLSRAIRDLRLLKPLAKPRLIKACATTAMADGHVSGLEGALLQGFAAALDCPLPPSIYQTDEAPVGHSGLQESPRH